MTDRSATLPTKPQTPEGQQFRDRLMAMFRAWEQLAAANTIHVPTIEDPVGFILAIEAAARQQGRDSEDAAIQRERLAIAQVARDILRRLDRQQASPVRRFAEAVRLIDELVEFHTGVLDAIATQGGESK